VILLNYKSLAGMNFRLIEIFKIFDKYAEMHCAKALCKNALTKMHINFV